MITGRQTVKKANMVMEDDRFKKRSATGIMTAGREITKRLTWWWKIDRFEKSLQKLIGFVAHRSNTSGEMESKTKTAAKGEGHLLGTCTLKWGHLRRFVFQCPLRGLFHLRRATRKSTVHHFPRKEYQLYERRGVICTQTNEAITRERRRAGCCLWWWVLWHKMGWKL
jgi:hypothetical protein